MSTDICNDEEYVKIMDHTGSFPREREESTNGREALNAHTYRNVNEKRTSSRKVHLCKEEEISRSGGQLKAKRYPIHPAASRIACSYM